MENTSEKILKVLLKNIALKPTITSLTKELDISRVGIWKAIKKMQSEKLIILSPVGSGKTSANTIHLNWDNSLVEKNLSLILTRDALNNQRWLHNFSELEKKVDFLILYGSILYSPKEAKDIDIISIVSNKRKFKEIDDSINKIQKTQIKKIHALNFTPAEFRREIKKQNKALIDALKKGVVLFGQEKFIKFMKNERS